MKITLEVSEENESTDSPWWAVVDPQQNMRADLDTAAGQITGPFFSRAEAEEYLKRRRYNYSKRAAVWCFSGYWSDQYKVALRVAAVEKKHAPTKAGRGKGMHDCCTCCQELDRIRAAKAAGAER